jgi:hypothetical protein
MGRKRVPGLIMRAGTWHIDKRILGRRICQSTGTDQVEDTLGTRGAPCHYLIPVITNDPR